MYQVFVEWDGCPDEKPLFSGPRPLMLMLMRKNWRKYNKGKMSLLLVGPNGRAESFVL